jgi:L-lysine 2,3-aminomutase
MFDEYLPGFFSSLKEVAEVLLSGDDLDYCAVQKLFRDGHTTMLLDEAMTYIDRPNTLREIVITGGKKPITITHEFIRF